MTSLIYVIRDDVSEHGLRRLHVVGMSNTEAAEAVLQKAELEGGQVELRYAWLDEVLDQWHAYGVWRCGMGGYPMYAVGVGGKKGAQEVAEAIWRGVERYRTRMNAENADKEEWRVIARKGLVPDEVMVVGDGNHQVTVRRVEVENGWQAGVVGVWREKAADG